MDSDKIIEELTATKQRASSNTHRINAMEKQIDKIKEQNIDNRVNKLEFIAENNKGEIKKLKDDASIMYKLAVNQEVMANTLSTLVEDNKTQMGAFTKTLGNMNDSLVHLNNSQQQTIGEMQNMKKDIVSTQSHVKAVEAIAQTNKENMQFNIMSFLSKDATKVLFTAILVAILSYIGLK